MSFRQVLRLITLVLVVFAQSALCSHVFVIPSAGSQNTAVHGFTAGLRSLGSPINPPPAVQQVLSSPLGNKAIFISNDPVSPVSFISVSSGQYSGGLRSLSLDGLPANRAVLSHDGERLYVLAGTNNGALYVLNLTSEMIVSGGVVPVIGTPSDIDLSPDGRYAYVISRSITNPGRLTIVDLQTLSVVEQITNIGTLNNVSVSPSGRVFVTGQFQLFEFSSQPPFESIGRTQLITSPGRLHFSPDGRYMLAGNILLNGRSVQVFDLSRVATNPSGQPGGPLPVSEASIFVTDDDRQIFFPDHIAILDGSTALAYNNVTGRVWQLSYPNLQVAEKIFEGVGTLTGVTGLDTSNEFPGAHMLYYLQGQVLRSYDLTVSNALDLVNIGTSGGSVHFAADALSGAPAEMVQYGGGQTVGPRVELRPYAVRVIDASGRPVPRAPVTFSSSVPGVTFSANSVLTNLDGIAMVRVTAPPTAGEFAVSAASGALSEVFVSTVTGGTGGGPGDPGSGGPRLLKVAGDGQLRQLLDGISSKPFVVRAVDGAGNPIAGVAVTWSHSQGVVSASPTSQLTDAKGEAEFQWIPSGEIPAGAATLEYQVTASSQIGTAIFLATSYPFQGGSLSSPTAMLTNPPQENRSITVKLGRPQTDAEAVRVVVVTGAAPGTSPGQPIRNVGVRAYTRFSNPEQGPVVACEGITAFTGDDGVARCKLLALGRVGTTDMVVDIGEGFTLFSGIRITVTPGDPTTPTITQGNNQTGRPGTVLPTALAARITDGFGNILAGTPVTWQVVAPPDTLTLQNTVNVADQAGLVSTRVLLGSVPGSHQIRLRAGESEVLFNVIVESPVAGFSIVSGNNQPAAVIGQQFALPLVVRVTDLNNQPVAGQSVSWAVTSGSAQVGSAASLTDNDGRASMTVTAGSTVGPIVVTATVAGQPPLNFTLSSRLPGPLINAASFRNAASNEIGVTPGGLVRIYGTGLAPGITGEHNANILGGRLPIEFAGVRVEFTSGGVSTFAPIYQVANLGGSESVLVQVPFELAGPTATATVNVQGGNTTVENIQVLPASPGVLEDNFAGGRRAAVVIRSDGYVVTPETPARRGETLRMYAIGLGQTNPIAGTNRVGQPDQFVLANIAVGIDNAGVEVVSAKLAENLIGIYEIIFVVPTSATIGNDRPFGFVMEVEPGQPLYANGSIIAIGAE